MTTFTASEVVAKLRERFASGNDVPVPDVRLTRAEFDVIADRLEADEKGVPVAYAQFTDGGCIRMWSRQYEERLPGTRMIPLYTHPSDTERLAEALRAKIRRLRNMPKGEFQLAASIFADGLERILAAHSAQAQPPAANVPDIETMVNRFLSWRLPKPWNPDNGISYTRPNYAHEPAEHDWPTGTNLFDAHQAREMIEYMLAAQESPNG